MVGMGGNLFQSLLLPKVGITHALISSVLLKKEGGAVSENNNALQGLPLDVLNWFAKQEELGRRALLAEIAGAFPNTQQNYLIDAMLLLQDYGYVTWNGNSGRLTLKCIDQLKRWKGDIA
jgi:hypothetical protein